MKIIGHRGAAAVLPENTLPSFARAWEIGADGVELDVRLTSDGEVVVFHDDDGQRLAGVATRVAETPYAVLTEWRVRGETIPRLEEVLTESPPHALTLIEIKCGQEIWPKLKPIVSKFSERPIGLLTFNSELAAEAVRLFPSIPVLLNLEPAESARLEEWVGFAVDHQLAGLSLGWSDALDHRAVRMVHRHELLVAVWTVNDPAVLRVALANGVDLLMTDDPGAMIVQVHRG
jgi:glycerophosphoryl diester phosphodiesterase